MGRGKRFIIALYIVFLTTLTSQAADLEQIYNIIKYVESNNKEAAVGDSGRAFGVVQIHKICVDDVNRMYGTSYRHAQVFEESVSKEVFMLYLKAGIKIYKRKYRRAPSESEIVRMWNGSIYNGYKKPSTVKYLDKYNKYKKLLG